ncbi:hypothetical protein B0T16DRAFT_385978 [Cercophora newfieldiana]|uniref:Uncharacterized protein n=1 Tax=Cercophora newfieldiana TaxID=92897 RepID=A0AA40CZK2_9PEZI|nr:hypothetical protein B0T16DRAFT_385978 [Cercophora newfieldiana]
METRVSNPAARLARNMVGGIETLFDRIDHAVPVENLAGQWAVELQESRPPQAATGFSHQRHRSVPPPKKTWRFTVCKNLSTSDGSALLRNCPTHQRIDSGRASVRSLRQPMPVWLRRPGNVILSPTWAETWPMLLRFDFVLPIDLKAVFVPVAIIGEDATRL